MRSPVQSSLVFLTMLWAACMALAGCSGSGGNDADEGPSQAVGDGGGLDDGGASGLDQGTTVEDASDGQKADGGTCSADEECLDGGADFVCLEGRCLRCGPDSGQVDFIYDGDTFYLEDGTRIRLLLMNTPEVANAHTGAEAECFGDEARDYVRSVLQGQRVQLAYDVSCRDRFDRLLAWVTMEDGTVLNRELVRLGYARVLFIAPNGRDHLDEYRELERAAQAEKRGLWGACP